MFDGKKLLFCFLANEEKQVITGEPSYNKVLDTLVFVVERERRSIDVEEVVVKRKKGNAKDKVSTLDAMPNVKKPERWKNACPKRVVKEGFRRNTSLLELLGLGLVASIIGAFDFLDNVLHLLDLALPLGSAHLGLAAEELVVGLAVAATETVPEGGELSVVVVEVQVVHGVAGGAVDDGAVGDVFTVVDHDGPHVDEHEESNVGEFLQREEEREDVVG